MGTWVVIAVLNDNNFSDQFNVNFNCKNRPFIKHSESLIRNQTKAAVNTRDY